MFKLKWQVQGSLGIVYFLGAIGIFIYGVFQRQSGYNYSHLWILALILLWASGDMIMKALRKHSAEKHGEKTQDLKEK
jgi:hypothetical protein